MKKYFIFFSLISFAGFSQLKNAIHADSKKNQDKIYTELKISRKQLMEVNTIRDLIPGIDQDCKIGQCNFVYTTESGRILTGSSSNGTGVQKCIISDQVRSLYVTIKSSCSAYNKTFKLIVK
jgi:hypothetical protein